MREVSTATELLAFFGFHVLFYFCSYALCYVIVPYLVRIRDRVDPQIKDGLLWRQCKRVLWAVMVPDALLFTLAVWWRGTAVTRCVPGLVEMLGVRVKGVPTDCAAAWEKAFAAAGYLVAIEALTQAFHVAYHWAASHQRLRHNAKLVQPGVGLPVQWLVMDLFESTVRLAIRYGIAVYLRAFMFTDMRWLMALTHALEAYMTMDVHEHLPGSWLVWGSQKSAQ